MLDPFVPVLGEVEEASWTRARDGRGLPASGCSAPERSAFRLARRGVGAVTRDDVQHRLGDGEFLVGQSFAHRWRSLICEQNLTLEWLYFSPPNHMKSNIVLPQTLQLSFFVFLSIRKSVCLSVWQPVRHTHTHKHTHTHNTHTHTHTHTHSGRTDEQTCTYHAHTDRQHNGYLAHRRTFAGFSSMS